ncbi:SDR family NAD(P)-dependent oxidoreductase [Streptomyces sp. SID8379]|uniref:SDR family NAD(P)-dependent oxidoreductase n=1 Tax=unclassified Streptomyces TaxID=2593676 RepID=UPI00037917B0|nr:MULTISPECIES: SDR family NAD(P)-dependent oxidoreductase [unclassified Streptomyces]MYW70127.1 SDR family NAD(P)-dependent oxidoreductase [Streptomyces sp. SID8379]
MSNLTPASPLRDWLADPAAGQVLRGMLAQGGQSEQALAPALGLPLEQLVKMSGGKFPPELVDALVTAAETGRVPEGLPTAPPPADTATAEPDLGVEIGAAEPWSEQITPGRFDGQTVVVTGAASGIGRAVASRIVREGGRVIAVDVSGDGLAALAADLGAAVVPVTADITAPASADAVLAAAGGRVDALANVAGVMDDDAAVHEVDDKIWDRVMRINVDGPMRLMRAVVPGMLAAGGGRIVNIVSEAALRGSAAGAAYTTSKHALVGLTKSSAYQYAGTGVQVNAVAPGAVATGIQVPAAAPFGSSRTARMRVAIPGLAMAEELAASIAFLLSKDAVNLNGVILPSDGGWSVA